MFPEFEDKFLSAIAFSLNKRRKSLGHKNIAVEVQKVYETSPGNRKEMLEATLRDSINTRKYTSLRLNAWPDRWVWIDARKNAKDGWVWNWTFEGRLLGSCSERDFVGKIEEALLMSHKLNTGPKESDVAKIWNSVLARGPEIVRSD